MKWNGERDTGMESEGDGRDKADVGMGSGGIKKKKSSKKGTCLSGKGRKA